MNGIVLFEVGLKDISILTNKFHFANALGS